MTVRVHIVMGGPSVEHEISLRSGLEVMANIDKKRLFGYSGGGFP